MIYRLLGFLRSLFSHRPVRLAIVRRYQDANGSYVGELYMEQTVKNVTSYNMVGVSLDSMPFGAGMGGSTSLLVRDRLDTANDFLAHMPPNTVRVGALDPRDNDAVRRMVSDLPRRNMTLAVQNCFIEHVLEPKRI